MIRKRPTRDEALAEKDAFSDEDKLIHPLVKDARDRLRDKGLKHGCKEVRAELQCNNADVVYHLRILKAIEGSKPDPYIPEADPQVPPTATALAAEAGANILRLPEILAEVLRAGVEEGGERARRNFEAKIEDADTTIGRLHAEAEVSQDTIDELAFEGREVRRANVGLSDRLNRTAEERNLANEQNLLLTANNTDLAAANGVLTDQVANLKTEITDVRRLNEVLTVAADGAKQECGRLKGLADTVPALQIEVAVCKEKLVARSAEIATAQGALKEAQERHTQEIDRIRHELNKATSRLAEFERLFGSDAKGFATVD